MKKSTIVLADIDWFFHSVIEFENRGISFETRVEFTSTGRIIGIIILNEKESD
jgi:hypothetical protein